jgi:hypothetical protein
MLKELKRVQMFMFKELGLTVMPKFNINRMTNGNSKLVKTILIFDTMAGTCGTCVMDCKGCYAKKSQNRYPMTRLFRSVNTYLAKNNINVLEALINKQISFSTKTTAVRLHSSGDFFSQDYVNMWDRIIKNYPDIKFYTYTKVEKLDFSSIESNSNFNLIHSLAINCYGEKVLNFGDHDHVKKLTDNGYFLCPATKENWKGLCGNDCNYCITGKKVCFNIH